MEIRRSARIQSRVTSTATSSLHSITISSTRLGTDTPKLTSTVHNIQQHKVTTANAIEPKLFDTASDARTNVTQPRKRRKVIPEEPPTLPEPLVKRKKLSRRVLDCENIGAYPDYQNNLINRQNGNKWVGAHVSAAGGVDWSVHNALSIGANSFALFLKSPRKWESPEIDSVMAESFKALAERSHYTHHHIIPHGCYLVNLATGDKEKRALALRGFLDDVMRCESLGVQLFNFHPGSALTAGSRKEAIKLIADGINQAHKVTKHVICVVENMAGQGNIIGSTWEDLRDIISHVEDKNRVGVCFDTCHAFAAGYDIRTYAGFDKVLKEFDAVIGLRYLRAVHLNDSKGELGCHRDRHENIGKGHIGLESFRFIMNDSRFDRIPLILETPAAEDSVKGYREEIELLYTLME